jgi:hypothetical protein
MKCRELLVRLAEVAHIYGDDEIKIRVSHRGKLDEVDRFVEVPISYLLLGSESPRIAIEEAALNQKRLPYTHGPDI